MNVLIVDDDPDMRLSLEKLIRHKGYSVCWAATVLGVEKLLLTEKIDVCIIDCEVGSSLEWLEAARIIDHKFPVIMISGSTLEQIEAFVIKPLDGIDLFIPKQELSEVATALDKLTHKNN